MLLNLKSLRKELNITQQQVANAIHVSQQTYSDYENCKTEPTGETLIEIARFFGVTVDELLGNSDSLLPQIAGNVMHDNTGLTEKEKALLKAFKNLMPETQDFVLRSVQSLSETNVEKSFKKS